ncbi:hypothetical protein PhCBS80983_g05210 [Powellomyces hirtus]|uniref:Uncharacterized protein n=1 Tax=Powellomyces hirtus TaxID=109895 RepID=A0A507DV41_9FUNG|nr:hypothetical protein PhCBS80983_g05210 [Powellomyces hirtus]
MLSKSGELENYPFCGAIDSTSSRKWKQKKTRSRVREVGEPRARLSLSSLSESHAVSPKIATARPKSSSVTALHITANSLAEHEAHQHYSEKTALFEALQTEVERLRTDEKQYTEQIKVLSADIHAERERRTKSEAICKLQETQLEQFITTRSRLEDLVRENQSLEAQMSEMKKASDTLTSRLDTTVSDLANTRQSLNLAHAEKANWQNDLANLRQSLDSALAEKENCQTQLREQDEILKAAKSSILSNHNALSKMEAQLHAAEEGNARLSVRLVKEREQFRVKFAELKVHKESDIYKGTIRQLQKEVSSLQKEVSSSHQQLASTGRDSRQQLREISWNLNSEVKLAVEATTTMMMEKHQEEVQAISKQLMNMRDAYNILEDEYRKGMKEERSRLSQLRKTCTELSHKCSEQVKDLQRAGFKEEEMARVIQELTLMLKDHKIQISDLTQKQKAAFATFEEKMRQMEDRAKIARKCRIDLEAAQIERSRLQGAVAVLTEEKQHMLSETEQKEARYNHEIAEMHNRTKELQAEIDRIIVDRDSNERTVRVKDKMLEDQNETIRHLKQNLDNKCREHQSLVSACEKRKGELEDRIETERAARDELQQEISSQRHLLDHLQSLAKGYKAERNSLRRDVSELAKKLQDRNDSIHLIEEEVARIRNVFKAKEDKWQQEKSCAIQAEKQAGLDMKIAYDAQCSRLAALEREREAMLQSLEKMQRELQAASAMKEQHESEMRLVLEELNRQKQKMDEKMKHLKALVV